MKEILTNENFWLGLIVSLLVVQFATCNIIRAYKGYKPGTYVKFKNKKKNKDSIDSSLDTTTTSTN